MTLLRFLAILYCSLLLLPAAKGQDAQNLNDAFLAADKQVIVLDTASSDSAASTMVIPNVFTPNGDGIHDYFEVSTDGVTVYDLKVFTRTGTQVFQSNSPRIFWEGTNSAGIDLAEGVYYYVIEEEGGSAPYSSAGFVYLFR